MAEGTGSRAGELVGLGVCGINNCGCCGIWRGILRAPKTSGEVERWGVVGEVIGSGLVTEV